VRNFFTEYNNEVVMTPSHDRGPRQLSDLMDRPIRRVITLGMPGSTVIVNQYGASIRMALAALISKMARVLLFFCKMA
ncbi:MAG TPA: hypothetical protein VER35_03470, partial [Candidatus Limnocylindrales bacterium]|nr:hypothetical protein [Candidatus Limnocylindrales bacterium]